MMSLKSSEARTVSLLNELTDFATLTDRFGVLSEFKS